MGTNRKHVNYWRESNNYRSEYFQKNPGLLGCIWFCSQCGKPLMGKDQVQVDHVVPPSAFAHKKYRNSKLISNTSILSVALNSSFNTVSICPKCNLKKSDNIGFCTAKGTFAKVGEVILSILQKVSRFLFFMIFKAAWLVAKLLSKPFQNNSPVIVKIVFICIYSSVVLYFLTRG